MLRVQRDEPGAFDELTQRYREPLIGRFIRQLGDRQEAEDLTQEVLLRLFRSRYRYRPRARFTTWLFHIAQNVARNAVRRRRRRACTPLGHLLHDHDQELKFRHVPDAPPPSEPLEQAELVKQVRAAVATLGRRQRTAVEMQFQDRTYREIAHSLAMSPEAAKSLLYRARQQLRESLAAVI